MNYVMIDTNIFLDMLIDRKKNVSGKLLESFIKLLDFDEIMLVIPAIVVHETNKHLKQQLLEVGMKIEAAKKAVEEIYGVNGYNTEGLETEDYKNESKKYLTQLSVKFEACREDLLAEIQSTIRKVFQHPNCKIIEDTEKLRSLCLKRRIYKRAPFHHEKKESFADATITETLVNIKEWVELKEDDSIIFCTGNVDDFSKPDIKRELHEDIYDDLCSVGLAKNITYATSFGELIKVVLEKEVANANLKEEFEKELREQEEMDLRQSYVDYENMERERIGLSPIDSFEDKFLEDFCSSKFVNNLKQLFARMNKCYGRLEEIESCYAEISDYVKQLSIMNMEEYVAKWNKLMEELGEISVKEDIAGIIEIIEWINQKEHENHFEVELLPDDFEYGDRVKFLGCEKEEYELKMDDLYLTCSSGERDCLEIRLSRDGELCARGNIDITYGYVEFDDDDGVLDAEDEDISYETRDLEIFLEESVEKFETYTDNQQKIAEKIVDCLDMDIVF